MNNKYGKAALTINLPLPLKQSLAKQAQEKGVTMTDLVAEWIMEHDAEAKKMMQK